MRVLDAHVHLWDRDAASFSWMDGTAFPHRCLPAELPEAAPFSRQIILVEAGSDAGSAVDEARWLSALVSSDEGTAHGLVGFVVHLPFDDAVAETLASLQALPGLVGVRRLLQDDDGTFGAPQTQHGLATLAEAGLPFDLCVRSHQLAAATVLVSGHRELTVVLDHCGKPPLTRPELLPSWRDDLARLAELPHVHCKLSGLAAEARDLPAEQAFDLYAQVIDHALAVFGPQRCLVGSDWPVTPLLHGRAAGWFDLVAERAGADADQVLVQNARRIYAGVAASVDSEGVLHDDQ